MTEERVCEICRVVQEPDPSGRGRRSEGRPRFELHHTSYVPEATLWLCEVCHDDLHLGKLPDVEGRLLPPFALKRAALFRRRRAAVLELEDIEALLRAVPLDRREA